MTATEAYAVQQRDADNALKDLARSLEAHAARQREAPYSWPLVGDLGHVNALLRELVSFLGRKT